MSRLRLSRMALLQTLTVLLLLLPIGGVAFYVWSKHELALKQLSDLEPRYERLSGILARQSEFKSLETRGKEQLSLLSYPSTQDVTQAGNDAQQRIRSLFAQNNLDIVSIQVLPMGKESAKVDRIVINLRVEGDLAGFQNALSKLATQTPVVLIDSLSLQTIGAVKPASIQRLGGQFNFFVLRMRP